jgi:hypothetical protein
MWSAQSVIVKLAAFDTYAVVRTGDEYSGMVRTRKWAKTAAACALPAIRAAHRKIMACIMQMPEMPNNGLGETYGYWYRPLEVIALQLKCEPTTSLCYAAVAARSAFLSQRSFVLYLSS